MSTYAAGTYGEGAYGGAPLIRPDTSLPTRAQIEPRAARAHVPHLQALAAVRPSTSTLAAVPPQRSAARVHAAELAASVRANADTTATVSRDRRTKAELHG